MVYWVYPTPAKLHGGQRELELARVELKSMGIKVTPYEHEEAHSLYFIDPDSNQIEL